MLLNGAVIDIPVEETSTVETSGEQRQDENVALENSAGIQQTLPRQPLANGCIQASTIDTQKMQELSLEGLLNDVEISKAAADAKTLRNDILQERNCFCECTGPAFIAIGPGVCIHASSFPLGLPLFQFSWQSVIYSRRSSVL